MLKRLKPSKDRVAGRPVIEYRKQSLNLAKIFLHRMAQFEVNPSIAKAKTISTRFYLDPRCLEESKEKIFAKSWQWIGDTTLIKENGSVASFLRRFFLSTLRSEEHTSELQSPDHLL